MSVPVSAAQPSAGKTEERQSWGSASMSPSITATVMWLWAVLVLCHYIHNACCFPQHTRSITPMRTLPRAHLHTHKRDGLAGEGHRIQAAAIDCWEISSVCHMCVCDAHVCFCSHHRVEWAELDGGFGGGVQEEQGRRPHPSLAGVWQCDGPGPLLPRYQKTQLSAWFNLQEASRWIVPPSPCAFLVPPY